MSSGPPTPERPDRLDAERFWFGVASRLRGTHAIGRAPLTELLELSQADGRELGWQDVPHLARMTGHAELSRPAHLLRLLAALSRTLPIESALDPFANSPLVLGLLESNGARMGVCPNREVAELAVRISGGAIQWAAGHPATVVPTIEQHFEWAVCSPPIGLSGDGLPDLPDGLSDRLARADAGLVPVTQALPLIDRGMLVLLTERFLWSQTGHDWRSYFASAGMHLSAAIAVPEGLAPATGIPTVLCLFSREEADQLFVGRVTESTDVDVLAANLAGRRLAKVPELGALVDPEQFMGWTPFASRLALERATKRSRVAMVPLSEVVVAIESGQSQPDEDPPTPHANALYFDARVVRRITTTPPEASPRARSAVPYFEVQLDTDRADAEFVATWLNGEHGQLVISSLAVGVAQKRIQRKALGQIVVPLPPVSEQAKSLALGTRLSGLRQEIANLEARLWTAPWSASGIEDELADLTAADPLRAWVDRLPFPLSVIVMRYSADGDKQTRVRRLLHFFEAWAEFHFAALLSVLRRHPDLWEEQREILRDPGPTGRHPLAEGNYGGWTRLGFHLAKVFRTKLSDVKEDDQRRALLGVASKSFGEALTDKRTWQIVDDARKVRNARGHGGEEGAAEIRRRLEKLELLLGQLRDATNHAYSRVELVQPGDSGRGHGIRRYATAKRLRGPLTTFVEREMTTQANVDLLADSLCFVDTSEIVEDALELIPLVRLLPSPETEQNAAFFFNKRDGEGFKFVSYHFPGEAETPLDDPGLAAIVSDLLG